MKRTLLILLAVAAVAWFGLILAAWLLSDGPNYSRVEPGLYLGGYVAAPPPGVTFALNLCETEDPYRAEHHAWEPIRDADPAPSLDWLDRQVQRIAHHRTAGRTVYVHCRNGVSRSGMVVVAYLMRDRGWDVDEAMAFVRRGRPGLRPHPAFLTLLREYGKRERPPLDGREGR